MGQSINQRMNGSWNAYLPPPPPPQILQGRLTSSPTQSRTQSPVAFGQRVVARRDYGVLEFYYLRISAVKQSKNFNFIEFSRASPGDQPLVKESEDSGNEIITNLAKEREPGIAIIDCTPLIFDYY